MRALVDHYVEERATEGQTVVASFFGGAPPDDSLLQATGQLPKTVRVRPDLLTRQRAQELVAAGVVAVELDALTFDDRALSRSGRTYRGSLVKEMALGLRSHGLEVGVVLAIGLPSTSHDTCMRDVAMARSLFDTARLHPVLVVDGSRLRQLHLDALYRPLELAEAVTACDHMVEGLEAGGVQVIRIGMQSGPDGLGRVVAGPRHPNLRQLVEARRVLRILEVRIDDRLPPGPQRLVIRCAPADETRTRGPFNQHVRTLRAQFRLTEVRIHPDPTLDRGCFELDFAEDDGGATGPDA